MPTEQDTHDSCAVWLENEPAWHGSAALAPADRTYDPTGAGSHAVAALPPLKEPGLQLAQADAPVEACAAPA